MPISPEFIIDEETPLRERYWQPKAGDVCIDIGAFHGSYTLPALAAGATVYAIDARYRAAEGAASTSVPPGSASLSA
jgi:2-polyprenyl-3-methyl-5-hydroxy-6-metoxy-1,4-benzoquinol methylase